MECISTREVSDHEHDSIDYGRGQRRAVLAKEPQKSSETVFIADR